MDPVERILDLGCGAGESWRTLGFDATNWKIIGLDRRGELAAEASRKYRERGWCYLCAVGESLPFADCSLDGVISRGSLPYMHIPRTLRELHRVLVPQGWLRMSLHNPSFTWSEFREHFPRPSASLGRTLVLVNGIVFHFTGSVMSVRNIAESCQTESGMRIALRRAGFVDVRFGHKDPRFLVEARRAGNVEIRKSA